MKVKKILIISSVALLSSCTSKPDYTWFKEGVSTQGTQYTIDDSKCIAESYKASPNPDLSGCNSGGSMTQGVCRGTLIGAAKKVRTKVYEGCMLEKGWEMRALE